MEKIIGKVIDKVEEHQQRHNKQATIPESQGGPGIDSGSGVGSGFSHQDDMDFHGAAHHAASRPNTNESPEFFSGILDQLGSKKQEVTSERINEAEAIAHHKAFYGSDSSTSSDYSSQTNPSTATSQSMGTAAALQALKLFTASPSKGGAYTPTSSFEPTSNTLGPSGGSGMAQTAQSMLIGLAMSQAAKLFEQQASRGNLAEEASKESAVMKAGEMALRLFLQSQRDSGLGSKYPAAGPGPALGALGGGGAGASQMGAAPALLNLAGRLMAA